MCIIAGYNGTQRAAPLIIEMLRKTEGIDAGCYTGIATLHEGKIHYRKLAGNLDRLLAETDAMDLPGNIGIMHSRTPGGYTGDSWAHPFVCEQNGELQTALLFNGFSGCYRPENEKRIPPKLRQLLADGYKFKSVAPYDGDPTRLMFCDDDGNMYHNGDILCQNVSQKILEQGLDPVTALEKNYEDFAGEHATLLLSLAAPDQISWARLNFPLYLGYAEHGICLATVPLAFADLAPEAHLLPALSIGSVGKDGYTTRKMPNPPFSVAPITPAVWHAAYTKGVEALKQGERFIGFTFEDQFPPADCAPRNAVAWELISELHRQGRLEMEKELIPGVREGLTTTRFTYICKD